MGKGKGMTLEKLKWAMGFNEKHPQLYRLWLWYRRPLFCKFGLHKFNWDEHGFSPCSGVMDFYCAACQKSIKSIPFDDLPTEVREQIVCLHTTNQGDYIGETEIKKSEIYGGALDGKKVVEGRNLTKNITWWGWSQKHKWRWQKTHIDLGMISIYSLKKMWFWNLVAFLILPLRKRYQMYRRYRDE